MTFEESLQRYSQALAVLEEAQPTLSAQQVLAVLVARDQLATALQNKNSIHEDDLLKALQLDGRLKQQAERILVSVPLPEWRRTFFPPPDAWWWFLEPQASHGDRFDWLWTALVVVCLTISLGLVADISSRFLSGGPDTWASMAVVGQSMLTLLAAGGALTIAGREGIKRILSSLNVPQNLWQEAKLILAIGLLSILLILRFSLPRIAVEYNNRGLQNYMAGNLTSARFDYERAIKLDPDYIEAHYNLALLYEDLQQLSDAQKEYLIAVQGGLDAAYNNLARLDILNQNYAAAVPLLKQGLSAAGDNAVKYDLHKNLGWARLGQARYEEAIAELQSAINLAPDRAPAHCLLAQVLEARTDATDSQAEWNLCLTYADASRPDEDQWIGLARQRLGEDSK
jgi:tetratricopeptide (TPR) repeat protein